MLLHIYNYETHQISQTLQKERPNLDVQSKEENEKNITDKSILKIHWASRGGGSNKQK